MTVRELIARLQRANPEAEVRTLEYDYTQGKHVFVPLEDEHLFAWVRSASTPGNPNYVVDIGGE